MNVFSFGNIPKKPAIDFEKLEWPKNEGCEGDKNRITLYKGQRIDRFGSKNGFYFGDAGDSYIRRSLPYFGNYYEQNQKSIDEMKENYYTFYEIADKDINSDYDYHQYEVLKEFDVSSCKIAPAFGFPGGGTQYWSKMSVLWLIYKKYIKEAPYNHHPLFNEKDNEYDVNEYISNYYKSNKSQNAGRRRRKRKTIRRKPKRRRNTYKYK